MKRFLLFQYNSYYPGGGWTDLYDSYDTLEEARADRDKLRPENHQIVDTQTWEVHE